MLAGGAGATKYTIPRRPLLDLPELVSLCSRACFEQLPTGSQHLAQQEHRNIIRRAGQGGNLTVATTGASGSLFLQHLLLAIEREDRVQVVNFIASDGGLRVLAEELGISGRRNLVEQLLGRPSDKIRQQANADIGANVASGSYPSDAMIVIPCSVGTLARIANGIASHLIERAADVCLKEKHPLVLCVRETPLNKIHIRNMYRAADAGATVFPLIPAFYTRPANAEAMAREFACRVLAYLGLPQSDAYQWKP
ncbi:MAG: UbiX family flavin prenyltransferase [Acidobacteria bacterium]|nr:UbiX family flavin prenyltransferase [Acidobacteriota bacterium]